MAVIWAWPASLGGNPRCLNAMSHHQAKAMVGVSCAKIDEIISLSKSDKGICNFLGLAEEKKPPF
ncbi:MAG TPA: hypothetical protein V6C71_20920 [Coleofasciculaceae cyanobacterium]